MLNESTRKSSSVQPGFSSNLNTGLKSLHLMWRPKLLFHIKDSKTNLWYFLRIKITCTKHQNRNMLAVLVTLFHRKYLKFPSNPLSSSHRFSFHSLVGTLAVPWKKVYCYQKRFVLLGIKFLIVIFCGICSFYSYLISQKWNLALFESLRKLQWEQCIRSSQNVLYVSIAGWITLRYKWVSVRLIVSMDSSFTLVLEKLSDEGG